MKLKQSSIWDNSFRLYKEDTNIWRLYSLDTFFSEIEIVENVQVLECLSNLALDLVNKPAQVSEVEKFSFEPKLVWSQHIQRLVTGGGGGNPRQIE